MAPPAAPLGDMDVIRAVLGGKKISYLGVSYGTCRKLPVKDVTCKAPAAIPERGGVNSLPVPAPSGVLGR